MTSQIREILPLAIGISISPVPIVAIILVLMTRKGATNGWAFVTGWILGLLLLVGGVDLLIQHSSGNGGQAGWVPLARIAFGTFLLVVSARCWSRRSRGGEVPEEPGWMRTLDRFGFPQSLGLGILLVIVNLKNLPLSISAAAVLARHQTTAHAFPVSFPVFLLVSTLGVAAPVAVAQLGGERTGRILRNWKRWLGTHNPVILSCLFLILGARAITRGLTAYF